MADKDDSERSDSRLESSKSKKKKKEQASVSATEAAVVDPKPFYQHFLAKDFFSNTAAHLPLIYSDAYNISFYGLEKLHPFDSCKYKNVVAALVKANEITKKQLIEPAQTPTVAQLLTVHSQTYLDSLERQSVVAQITEIPVVLFFPMFLIRAKVLTPFLLATSGSIAAGYLAVEYGAAINIGGGFHHCCGENGGGFCTYADITLSLRFLRQNYPHRIKNVMIIDLDAHQGNGHENDKLLSNDTNLYILDVYNPHIYPGDLPAKSAINTQVLVRSGTEDKKYLAKLKEGLDKSFKEFVADVIYYNAGTDVLDGDPLGQLCVSPDGVVTRDEMVFQFARDHKVPIVMLLSGGYQRSNAAVIARSIANLNQKFEIFKLMGGS